MTELERARRRLRDAQHMLAFERQHVRAPWRRAEQSVLDALSRLWDAQERARVAA